MGKHSKDKRDIYYRKAKEEGWRARSAFKLLQLDEEFDLFSGVTRAVDLCAAPGSWSQVLARRCAANAARANDVKIVAIDLQEMAPIEGVEQITGDITDSAVADRVLSLFRDGEAERLADLVVCDGAPDVTGMHDLDEYLQAQLLLSAFGITAQLLRPRGTFVAKVFRGKDITLLYAQLKLFFPSVVCAKPKSSRNTSVEAFVVCRGFAPPDGLSVADIAGLSTWQYPSAELGSRLERTVVPFVACGDLGGYDADANYPLPDEVEGEAYVSREPVQKPTTPAYRAFLEACSTGRALVLDHEMGCPPAGAAQGRGVGGGRVDRLDGAWAALNWNGGSRPGECDMFDALTQ